MKRKLLLICLGVLVAAGCQNNMETPAPVSETPQNVAVEIDRDAIALHMVDLLNEQLASPVIISTLQKNRLGVAIGTILNDVKAKGFENKTTSALRATVNKSEKAFKNIDLPDNIEIPEVWMHIPSEKFNRKDILVSYPPMEGDEHDWKEIKAYTLDKKVVYLDPKKAPDVPVVVVETRGHEAFLLQVACMNKMLSKAGLQPKEAPKASFRTSNAGVETSILRKISLKDDEDPWIKGAAEIYAITSGIRSNLNEPAIKIIPMEYLDYDGKNYYPNQIMLFWDEYEYQAANILFYEQDSNYNYKELVDIIIKGVINITGTLTGLPWLTALGEITSAIIQAMPNDWYTDTDDYVDALYTIEKTQSYYNYWAAGQNAQVNIEPYFIPAN